MNDWFKQNKVIVFLFLLAFLPRLIFSLIAFLSFGDEVFINNSDVYLEAGLNLLKHHTFTNFSDNSSLTPNSFPAPGYPILLGISWLIIPKYFFIVFWQNILYSLFIVFVYKFARLFFNKSFSIAATLFMAFEPFSLFWSNTVMSETPFLLFFMLSIYFLALSWQNQKWKHIILSAVFLGLAAWIRQIAFLFYPVIVLTTLIMLWRKVTLSRIVKLLAVFLFVFLAVTAPWCIRNKIQFDTYTISNQTHFLYFFDVVPNYLALTTDMSVDEAFQYLKDMAVNKVGAESFDDIYLKDQYIPILKEINSSIIKSEPLTFLKFHLIKALPTLTDSGWMNILAFWNFDLNNAHSISISDLLVQKDFRTLISELQNNPAFLIRILGIAFWLLIDLIALIGIVLMVRNKKLLRIALVMSVIIGYFFITSSWAAMARLRLPLQPFLFIFVIYAIYYYSKFYENKYCHSN